MKNKSKNSFPKNIQTGKEIEDYFENTKNPYTDFISQKQKERSDHSILDSNKAYELHHKIPKHAGGTDIPENLILLSFEDHTFAHQLLFQVYGNFYDYCAYNMRIGKNSEARKALQKAVVEQMKLQKQGRFNSENQRKCAIQNKGKKKPHSKTEYMRAACQKGMIWVCENGNRVRIEPNSCQGPGQIVELLLFGFSQSQQQNYVKNKSKSFIYSGVVKLIVGWRDKKTKKSIYRVGPWRLEGILLE